MKPDDKQHIEAICRRHNIHLITPAENAQRQMFCRMFGLEYSDVSSSAARPSHDGGTQYGIWLNPDADGCPNEDSEYFSALHEIGHCVLKHGRTRSLEDMVNHEIEAWEWAYSHAQRFPDEEAMLWTLDCLATYTDQARMEIRVPIPRSVIEFLAMLDQAVCSLEQRLNNQAR